MGRETLKDLGLELEEVAGLTESTVEPAAPVKRKKPKKKKHPTIEEKEPVKEEDLVRITIRVEPELEDRLYEYQRMLRKQKVSKRDSSFNTIIIDAIKEFLENHKD